MIAPRPARAEPAGSCLPLSENLFLYRDACNVYVVRHGSQALLIDFGSGDVLDQLEALGIERVTDVLITHHHRDQVQGLRRAAEAGLTLWVPAAERELVESVDDHWQARELANSYNNRQDRFSLLDGVRVDHSLRDYATLDVAGTAVQVVPTPGHTVGSITLLMEVDGNRCAFSGDLIAGPGRVWSLAATQWTYNGAEGVAASILSLLDLKARDLTLVLPSHGDPIPNPERAITLLVDRLGRLLDLRREHLELLDLRARPYEVITPHLLRNRTSVAYSYVLLSSSGKALMIDFGYDFTTGLAAGSDRAARRPWLHSLPALKTQFGVERIDAVIPTHYHDDHVAGFNLLREVEGTQVWAPENFAPVLERPLAYDLPCLWYEPIPVDRRLALHRPIRWEEYELILHEQPGHTRYAVAVALTVDERRVLIVGDQMGSADGRGLNYVYNNEFAAGDYRRSAELYAQLQPELLLTGHWKPLPVGPGYFDDLRQRGEELERLHQELLPQDLDLERSGRLARVHPYQQTVAAGRAFELAVEVRNPSDRLEEIVCTLVTPPGWPVQPGEWREVVPAGGSVEACFKLAAPAGVCARRVRLAADVVAGGRRLGQVAECLVTVR